MSNFDVKLSSILIQVETILSHTKKDKYYVKYMLLLPKNLRNILARKARIEL